VADDNAQESTTKKGPSGLLMLAGLLALAVSVWALAGPSAWSGLLDFHFGWVFVVAAIVVGLVLVVSPGKRS